MRFKDIVAVEFEQDYYKKLHNYVENEYLHKTIFPPRQNIFRALNLCDYEDVKVVILGQDPYHGPNQAHGLSFSVKKGVTPPPSLQNIFLELHNDIGCQIPAHGELTKWANQGVLLLNSVLTVRRGKPNSHQGMGWEILTDEIISKLNERREPIVFLLWGRYAKEKASKITNPQHLVLTSSHPSPYSASYGFLGCRHFSKTNAFLKEHGIAPIDWQIE